MKSLIVYYSRTGNTARVASALARELNADMFEIHCEQYRGGPLRYLLTGYDSVMGRLPEIEMPRYSAEDYDLLLIGTPVWTSHPSLPVRAFAAARPPLPARIGLFLTYGGHSPAQKAIDEISAMLGSAINASLVLGSDQVKAGDFTDAIVDYVGELRNCEF
ncbi:flavodoxin family protein [Hoeflea sp. TYP-13]|uniref:flavodoxin family protein n=1 Tax=Hoeflea sp. TYP-13 TaxID=3230023 RepID=UPI0034C6B9C2